MSESLEGGGGGGGGGGGLGHSRSLPGSGTMEVVKYEDEVMPLSTPNKGVSGEWGSPKVILSGSATMEWQNRMQMEVGFYCPVNCDGHSRVELMKDEEENLRGNKVDVEINGMSGGYCDQRDGVG